MVKIKEGWSASSPLIQKETERFDDGCLASVVFSQQDVHARSELDGQIGKAPEGGLMPTFSMPSLHACANRFSAGFGLTPDFD
jgi:hypothetical protein